MFALSIKLHTYPKAASHSQDRGSSNLLEMTTLRDMKLLSFSNGSLCLFSVQFNVKFDNINVRISNSEQISNFDVGQLWKATAAIISSAAS